MLNLAPFICLAPSAASSAFYIMGWGHGAAQLAGLNPKSSCSSPLFLGSFCKALGPQFVFFRCCVFNLEAEMKAKEGLLCFPSGLK